MCFDKHPVLRKALTKELNMASKEAERKCLKEAIEYLKKQKGIAKDIGLSLDGTDVKRTDTEHPDFLLHSTGDNGALIAVEHFEVDMLSTVSGDKVLSFSNKFQKDTKHIFDKWSEKVISSDKVPDGAVDDVVASIAERFEKKQMSSYKTFIESFRYSLEKHEKKIDDYISNSCKYKRDNCDFSLGFLIEIRTSFPRLFTNNLSETGSINNGLSPLFADVVSMLKKVDSTKVSFFVLVFRTSDGTDFSAIAFRSGDKMDADFEKQQIDIYEYVGEDRWIELYNCIDPKCDTTIERVDDRYDVNFSMSYQSLDPEIQAALTMHCVYAIQYCKWKKLKYVVTYLPYAIEKECGDLIQSWTFDKYGFARPLIAPPYISLFIKKLNEIEIPAPPGL